MGWAALTGTSDFYQPKYDSIEGAAGWAKETLESHAKDDRWQRSVGACVCVWSFTSARVCVNVKGQCILMKTPLDSQAKGFTFVRACTYACALV